jgi:protein TonB
VYPELLKEAGIQGRVVVQAVIDTLGRAVPTSVKILQSPNPGFDRSAGNYVLNALLRPARVHGRAVRVLINIPIDFRITSAH